MTEHDAKTDHPVHELIARRWSPYVLDAERGVDVATLRSLFEAARWAPSCYNEQPWRYVVARREDGDAFAQVLDCLVDGNRGWARHAAVLALGCVTTRFARNDNANGHARHDLGLATAGLTVEATARGLVVHQMAGILPDVARERFELPDGVEAVTGIAIGYAGAAAAADAALAERDARDRARRPLGETVFAGAWGSAAAFLTD